MSWFVEEWFQQMLDGFEKNINLYFEGIADEAESFEEGLKTNLKQYSIVKDYILEQWGLGVMQLKEDYTDAYQIVTGKKAAAEKALIAAQLAKDAREEAKLKDAVKVIIKEIARVQSKYKDDTRENDRKKEKGLSIASDKKDLTIRKLKNVKWDNRGKHQNKSFGIW